MKERPGLPPHPLSRPRRAGRGRVGNYLLLVFVFSLLIPHPARAAQVVSASPVYEYKGGETLKTDTTWKGTIAIDGVVFVPEGVALTIEPGTTVRFNKSSIAYKDEAEKADPDAEVLIPGSGIKVEGKIIAAGKKEVPITFTSASKKPAPGDWGCIFLDHSKGSIFKYCRFEYSAYTIHAHFSQFEVSRCTITHNEDGSRLGLSRVSYDHCDITDNTGKGLNFRQCKNTVRLCNITGNRDGIFLNEKDDACVIEQNNILGNKGMDLRLGEFHTTDITLKDNWWGTPDLAEIAKHVYDKKDDPAIGKAVITPAAAPILDAGADALAVKVKWKFKTGAYVDCNPAISGGVAYFGSWDKNFYAVKADTGELIWKFATGDCVDSSPAVMDGKVYFGSWDRNIYCLGAKSGKLIWKYQMPPSNFDDHRQSSPAVCGKSSLGWPAMVIIGGFNGIVYAVDAETGKKVWEFQTGGSIRNRPLVSPSRVDAVIGGKRPSVYIGSSDGFFYVLEIKSGNLYWKFKAGGPIKSSPVPSSPVLVEPNSIYFGSVDGYLYHFFEVNEGGDDVSAYYIGNRIEYSSPLIVNDLVIIGDCGGILYAADRETGKKAWSFTGQGGIYSSPCLAGGKVVYGDNAGVIYWLDPKTGCLEGVFKAGDAVQGISAVKNGAVYAGSRDGYLYCLEIEE